MKILIYWLVFWGIAMFYSTFVTLTSLTPDGLYVEKLGSEVYFVPAGLELKKKLVTDGLMTGIGTTIIGYTLMAIKYIKSNK